MAIKLPNKKYLTFKEVQDLWGVTENDLRRLLIAEEITPSYFIDAEKKYSKVIVSEDGMEAFQSDVEEEVRFFNQGLFTLDTPTQVTALDGYFSSIRIPDVLLTSKDKHPAEKFYILKQNISISEVLENGVLTMEEIYRFERTNKTQELDAREKTTFLNIIGGLLDLMLGKNERGLQRSEYTKQESIIGDLLELHKSKAGISKATLEAKFAAAKRSLNSD